MPRIVLALVSLFVIAAVLLLLRQQNLRLRHACNVLHAELLDIEQVLWRQQVQVAAATSPSAIEAVRAFHVARAGQTAGNGSVDEWAALSGEIDAW